MGTRVHSPLQTMCLMTENHLASCCHRCRSSHQQGLNSNQAPQADTRFSLGATGPPAVPVCTNGVKYPQSNLPCVLQPWFFIWFPQEYLDISGSRRERAAAYPARPDQHSAFHLTKSQKYPSNKNSHRGADDYRLFLWLFSC